MKKLVLIENWAIVYKVDDPYAAPETNMRLTGKVFGHPTKEDGEAVTTSRIRKANGRIIETGHTTYILGTVDTTYAEWYNQTKGHPIDQDNPIKFID